MAEKRGLGRCYVPLGRTFPLIAGKLQVGLSTWPVVEGDVHGGDDLLILNQHRPYLEMLLKILQHGWMCILAGPHGAGTVFLSSRFTFNYLKFKGPEKIEADMS